MQDMQSSLVENRKKADLLNELTRKLLEAEDRIKKLQEQLSKAVVNVKEGMLLLISSLLDQFHCNHSSNSPSFLLLCSYCRLASKEG